MCCCSLCATSFHFGFHSESLISCNLMCLFISNQWNGKVLFKGLSACMCGAIILKLGNVIHSQN